MNNTNENELKVSYTDGFTYGSRGLGRAHDGDAGLCLRSTRSFTIAPHETRFVPCGVRLGLPRNTFGAVRPSLKLARDRGVSAIEGTIDENYVGEIGCVLVNNSDEPASIRRGDHIAQLVVIPYAPVSVVACA